MLPVRSHPDTPHTGPTGAAASASPPSGPAPVGGTGQTGGRRMIGEPGAAGRLNVLLSYATWRDNSWADALPTLLEPLGVQAHRARTGRQAERTIRSTPIHIAVVDLGLPLDDEPAFPPPPLPPPPAGARILELLRRLDEPPPTVVIKSATTPRDEARDIAAALRFDAFAVVDRHAASIELMLQVFQRALARFYHDRWPTAPASPSPIPPTPSRIAPPRQPF